MSNLDFNLNLEFDLVKNKSNVIKVIGVGGGGGNAVNYMYSKGIKDVDFVVVNTDSQDLNKSPVPIKVQIGTEETKGLGAGANPEIGEKAAIENLDSIKEVLNDQTKMIFITAGMGGGTGTGAAPIIAKLAKEMGILTVAIVTSPFIYEGKKRNDYAMKGIDNLREYVDSLIIINNNKLREIYGNLTYKNAFAKSDEVLASAATSIAEVITHNFTVNVDFRDVKTVLENSGTAIMGSARAQGENRAEKVIQSALDSPLLNDNKITGAKNILLLIVSGKNEITIDEISEITDYVQSEAGHNADVILGLGEDPNLGDDIAVTIVATGFNKNQQDLISNAEPEKIVHVIDNSDSSIIVETETANHLESDNGPELFAETEPLNEPENDEPLAVKDDFGNKQFLLDFEDEDKSEKEDELAEPVENNTEYNDENVHIELIDKENEKEENNADIQKTDVETPAAEKKQNLGQALLFNINDEPQEPNYDDVEDLTELPLEVAFKLRKKRKSYIKNYTTELSQETNDEPAFKKKGIEVDLSPKSSETVHKIEIDSEGNLKLKDHNSFLEGNVD